MQTLKINFMGQYGRVALRARCLIIENHLEAIVAWRQAATDEIVSLSSREKSCPRSAFIGLCKAGYIVGINGNGNNNNGINMRYAIDAINFLATQDQYIIDNIGNSELWNHVDIPKPEKQQGQMDVVLALRRNELIQMP